MPKNINNIANVAINKLFLHIKNNNIDTAIDEIFDITKNLVQNNSFKEIDVLCNKLQTYYTVPDIVIALLIATFPFKDKLPSRNKLINHTIKTFRKNSNTIRIISKLR